MTLRKKFRTNLEQYNIECKEPSNKHYTSFYGYDHSYNLVVDINGKISVTENAQAINRCI